MRLILEGEDSKIRQLAKELTIRAKRDKVTMLIDKEAKEETRKKVRKQSK